MNILKTRDISALSSEDLIKMRRSAIIKLTITFIFAAVIIVFQTISWFSNSKESSASGIGIRIEADQGYDVKYNAYKYDLKDEHYVDITGTPLALNEYDVIFQERNRYAGILLRLEVDGSFSQQSEILRVTRDLSLREDEDYDPNEDIFVSDVTQFHVANEDDCLLDKCIAENSNYDLWDEALAYFLPDNNAPSPTEFSTGESSINLSFTPSTNGHTVLWMFINYDSELVQAKIGSGTVTLNELISVVPDCNIIKVIAS
ncbi:hypothetical protein [uncultured Ruminococcus sp.]|uniref:hypothetical protein n=1 Tax=uncultured Ruminococcus sp. TaxID=165186 RepID=UPI0025D24958|nr:hypothetical protein [uncultured Ruminococcus sp.]